jgi:hypothetical protein
MSRDAGSFEETKAVINRLREREAGNEEIGPTGSLNTKYTGGKVHPTLKDFAKPSVGTMRKHLD